MAELWSCLWALLWASQRRELAFPANQNANDTLNQDDLALQIVHINFAKQQVCAHTAAFYQPFHNFPFLSSISFWVGRYRWNGPWSGPYLRTEATADFRHWSSIDWIFPSKASYGVEEFSTPSWNLVEIEDTTEKLLDSLLFRTREEDVNGTSWSVITAQPKIYPSTATIPSEFKSTSEKLENSSLLGWASD